MSDPATPPVSPAEPGDTHAFKNFHRMLCERFGYTHDERDWRRDQVSLMEWIAKQISTPPAPALCESGSDYSDPIPTAPLYPQAYAEGATPESDERARALLATPPASPAEPGDAWDRILADPELARARQKLSIHEIRMIVKHAQATPPAPAATDEEVGRMVERLEEDAGRLEARAYGDRCFSPDCALASNVAREAADLLARVAKGRGEWKASWQRDHDLLLAGKLHEPHCNYWTSDVGCPGCSCQLGRKIRQAEQRAEAAEKLLRDINDDTAVSWVHEEITAHLAKHAGGDNG